MADIFISYAREDQEKAARLAERLGQVRQWSVWWDRTILPGHDFADVIQTALDAAKCVIVLWSKDSVASQWVRVEAAEALRRRILVPILLDPVTPPLEFRAIQMADLTTWDWRSSDGNFDRLLAAIERLTATIAPSAPAPAPATLPQAPGRTGSPSARRRPLIMGAGVATAAAAIALLVLRFADPDLFGQRAAHPNESAQTQQDGAANASPAVPSPAGPQASASGAADLTAELRKELETYQTYFETIGYISKVDKIPVEILDQEHMTPGAISYYDPDAKRIVVLKDVADNIDILRREYSHQVLMLSSVARNSNSYTLYAIESGLADYLVASFKGSPKLYDQLPSSLVEPLDLAAVPNFTDIIASDGAKMYSIGRSWSGAFWTIRTALGARITDRVLLESWTSLPAQTADKQYPTAFVNQILNRCRSLPDGDRSSDVRQIFLHRSFTF
jgi:hypothetical protein